MHLGWGPHPALGPPVEQPRLRETSLDSVMVMAMTMLSARIWVRIPPTNSGVVLP